MVDKFSVIDVIVDDSLVAVEEYRDGTKSPVVVLGGIAVQLYAHNAGYPGFIRPTHDLDLLSGERLSAEQFRAGLGESLAAALQQYAPEVAISRHVYEVKLEEGGVPFFVHSYKWSAKGFERERRDTERQVSNANFVRIPNTSSAVHVVRPEDIMAGKISRLRKGNVHSNIPAEGYPEYSAVSGRKWDTLAACDLAGILDDLIRRKNRLPALYDAGRERFEEGVNVYRSAKDMYDIAVLLKLAASKTLHLDVQYLDRILDGKE